MSNDRKQNFYIFLDIDGVLWDWKWRISEIKSGNIARGGRITQFNPESINAVNNLISKLNNFFNCQLVVSSTWRINKEFTIKMLKKNGLVVSDDNSIHFTPLTLTRSRGQEVMDYLADKPDNNNLLIIDDEYFDFPKYFQKGQMIKTNIYDRSLSQQHIDNWLGCFAKKNNISLEEKEI